MSIDMVDDPMFMEVEEAIFIEDVADDMAIAVLEDPISILKDCVVVSDGKSQVKYKWY